MYHNHHYIKKKVITPFPSVCFYHHRWGLFHRQRPSFPPKSAPFFGCDKRGVSLLDHQYVLWGNTIAQSGPVGVALTWLWPPKALLIVLRRPTGAERDNKVTRLSNLLGRTALLAWWYHDSWHCAQWPLTQLRLEMPGGVVLFTPRETVNVFSKRFHPVLWLPQLIFHQSLKIWEKGLLERLRSQQDHQRYHPKLCFHRSVEDRAP